MTPVHIPETVVAGKRLGRHIDPRAAAHRETGGPPPLAPKLITVTHKVGLGMPLDQGDVGSCTGNALVGALNTVPHWKAGNPVLDEQDAQHVYSTEQVLMGYGPFPPADNGGTGQFVCEAGMKEGWVSDFQTAIGLDEALRALVLRPVITGINWYDSFDQPRPSGLVKITSGAQVRGGHEIVAVRVDAIYKLVWFVNSWGTSWGVPALGVPGGCFCMSFDDWGALLEQQGDVTVPRTAHGWKA